MASTHTDDEWALREQLGETPPRSTTMPVPDPNVPPVNANNPRVTQGPQGTWQLQEHGNTRDLQGQEIEDAKKYVSDFQSLGQSHAPPITNMGLGSSTVQPSTYSGYTPKHAMEGFNYGREQNTGKSAKDAFAYLSNQAPPPPINDKAALGAWFKQYIEPGMNQLGHKVNSVNGDVFNYSNWEGTFDVDFGRGAGAEGGALAWQVQPQTARMSGGAYTPRAATPTAPAPVMPAPVTPTPATSSVSESPLARLQAEIDALLAGRSTPTEADALRQQLR